MIFKGHMNVFGGQGGVIFRPEHTRILCSYGGGARAKLRPRLPASPPEILCARAADGGTRDGCQREHGCQNNGCGPSRDAVFWRDSWCNVELIEAVDGWCSGKPYLPEDLGAMLRGWSTYGTVYNEVVVDTAWVDARLPHSVEAFLWDRAAHEQFLALYGVSAVDYPLVGVRYDDPNEPFYLL